MNIFQLGKFQLNSGKISDFKIECDALTDEELDCIAFLLSKRLPSFGSVEGIPTGGLRLAAAMQKYVTTGPILVVDDVWTTGGSFTRYWHKLEDEKRASFWSPVLCAVIFSRNPHYPPELTPLFVMPMED